VLVVHVADLSAEAKPPDGMAIREVFGRGDLRRIGAMEAAVWDDDHSWRFEFGEDKLRIWRPRFRSRRNLGRRVR
jgi:hypothetical protein